jgi:hypothetical protein
MYYFRATFTRARLYVFREIFLVSVKVNFRTRYLSLGSKRKTDNLRDCFWIALAGYVLLFFHFRDLYLMVTNRMKVDNGAPLFKNSFI